MAIRWQSYAYNHANHHDHNHSTHPLLPPFDRPLGLEMALGVPLHLPLCHRLFVASCRRAIRLRSATQSVVIRNSNQRPSIDHQRQSNANLTPIRVQSEVYRGDTRVTLGCVTLPHLPHTISVNHTCRGAILLKASLELLAPRDHVALALLVPHALCRAQWRGRARTHGAASCF